MTLIDSNNVNMYYGDPVVHIVFDEDIELGFSQIREIFGQAEKLSGHKPHVILAEVKADVSITQAGRRFGLRKEEAPFHRGTAVVIKKELYPLAVAFLNYTPNLEYPFRVFADKEKAIRWLNGISVWG
jgi:hypothetical protein